MRALGKEDGKRKRSASGGGEDGGGADADRFRVVGGAGDVMEGKAGAPGGGEGGRRDGEEADGGARRKKWTRLLLRELYDLGFRTSAECLEREAGVQLRSDAMKALEAHVRACEWDAALALVAGANSSLKLSMKSTEAAREAALLLLRRKYIDFLMKRELRSALQTFQNEIMPAHALTEDETKQLAVLLLCTEAKQVEQLAQMPWKEAELLASIERLVSPEEIIPEGALQVRQHILLHQEMDASSCRYVAADTNGALSASLRVTRTWRSKPRRWNYRRQYSASVRIF